MRQGTKRIYERAVLTPKNTGIHANRSPQAREETFVAHFCDNEGGQDIPSTPCSLALCEMRSTLGYNKQLIFFPISHDMAETLNHANPREARDWVSPAWVKNC